MKRMQKSFLGVMSVWGAARVGGHLDVGVHHLAHLAGADGCPAVAVEERVQPPRRRRRRHVHKGVALVELGPAQTNHQDKI